MIHRLYTWEVTVPGDQTPEEARGAAERAAGRVAQFNPNVETTEVELAEDGVLRVTVHFTGRDQWWIKKKIVFAIGGILAQAGIPHTNARLVAINRPDDQRSVRGRASDGRHKPLPDTEDIDHSDMGLVI